MAFNLNNLLSTLDSSIGLLDSSSDLLSILQAINVTNPTMGHGKSQKKTYATRASLPAASVSLRGSLAVVQVIGDWEASGNADNGLYVCTGNDWALVQGLDSAGTPPLPFQGSTSGYTSGGFPSFNIIDKFPFASDDDATDVGDLTTPRNSVGQSSENHGYCSGAGNIIDKFPFASDFSGTATDVGDLLAAIDIIGAGQSSNRWGFGYHSGGRTSPGTSQNVIQKFAFATDANATDFGDLTAARHISTGQSSYDNGYVSAGAEGSPAILSNVIDKFTFSSDFTTATDVGDLTVGREGPSGQSSSTHGYTCGGHQRYTRYSPDGIIATDIIDKFPFAADGNATYVGVLSGKRATYSAGTSSTANGYATAGATDQYGYVIKHIDKFSFSSDASATDVLNLTATRSMAAGQQI